MPERSPIDLLFAVRDLGLGLDGAPGEAAAARSRAALQREMERDHRARRARWSRLRGRRRWTALVPVMLAVIVVALTASWVGGGQLFRGRLSSTPTSAQQTAAVGELGSPRTGSAPQLGELTALKVVPNQEGGFR